MRKPSDFKLNHRWMGSVDKDNKEVVIDYGQFSLREAKKLQKFLSKAIKYLESKP